MTDSYFAEAFLVENTYCVLAVADEQGKPHASMMHFAVGIDPIFDVYFVTSSGSRKAQTLHSGPTNASMVVGSGETWKTLQMDGVLTKVSDTAQIEIARKALYAKYPDDKYHEIPDAVFMHFRASWYRYADFSSEPALILPWGEQKKSEVPLSNPD